MTTIVGRARELERIDALLSCEAGAACLVFQGEAGLGKSTLWRWAIASARARGYEVLTSRPLELDISVPFAGLNDLLSEVIDEVLEALPAPQRRALDTALLRADPTGSPPEAGTIAFAVLNALQALARRGPVLIGIDDVQWLDEPSATALRFAGRRLESAPVRLIVTERVQGPGAAALGLERVLEPGQFESIALAPLSLGAIQHILQKELGLTLTRPLLLRLHATSGGNPFYALELARALERYGGTTEPGQPLPVPQALSGLVEQRLDALPRRTQRGLEIAALLADATLDLVREAAGADVDLRPAVRAGVAELDGNLIRFTHPLLAATVAARISEDRRRGLHRRLALLVMDPVQRARHSALATAGVDRRAAEALEQAAHLATGRGAPVVAAELLEHALLHTPQAPRRKRALRLLETAQATQIAGDPDRALALALQANELLPPGRDRARALLLIGEIDSRIPALEQAVVEADEDALMRAQIRIQLSECCFERDLREALAHSRRAADDAGTADDPGLLAQALTMQSWFEGATGSADPEVSLARAEQLEPDDQPGVKGDFTSTFTRASLAMWRDEHELARQGFESLRQRAATFGRAYEEAHALLNLAQVQWRAGSWEGAAEHVQEAVALWPRGDPSARALARWMRAVIAAHRGQLEAARAEAEDGLAAAGTHRLFRARNLWVLGFVSQCEGELDDALASLEEAAALFDDAGALEPGMRLFEGDLLAARVATDQLARADTLAEELLRRGNELRRPRATVIGGRGKGLVLAARGELEPALEALASAAVVADRWPVPFEQGRTRLALGTVQRRARHQREARATLEQAVQLFEGLGAPLFLQRAHDELGRIGGRTPSEQGLTAAEQRIAEHVARGLTNREVAAELVVAVHTVESALTRIYSKLGVRSRTELARRFAARA